MATMEEAFDMVENLTEELTTKEETIMKHEKEIKDLEKERNMLHQELYMTNQVYQRWGHLIFSNMGNSAPEVFEEEYIDAVAQYDPLGDAHEFRIQALVIFMDNNNIVFGDGTVSDEKIISESDLIERFTEARQYYIDDMMEDKKSLEIASRDNISTAIRKFTQDIEDTQHNIDIYDRYIEDPRSIDRDDYDIMELDWLIELPEAYNKGDERYYFVMWRT